jgi:hypothetical protein
VALIVNFELISLSVGLIGGIGLLIAGLPGLSGRQNVGHQPWIKKALLVASLGCLGWAALGFVNLSLGSHHKMYLSIIRVKAFFGGIAVGILIALFLSGQFRTERRAPLSEDEAPGR